MAGNLKSDLINGAFSILRISGLTVIPKANEQKLALSNLEEMAAEFEANNIYCAYNFTEDPDYNDDSGIELKYRKSFKVLLATRMMSDFGKGANPDPVLMKDSSWHYSYLSARTAQIKEVQAPRTMPTGSGNRFNEYWRRYNYPTAEAPISAATVKMIIGDIEDFEEDFTSYLKETEDVASYVLTADEGLTVVSESLSTPVVSYRIEAVGSNNIDPGNFYQIKIVATTDDSRIKTRIINFSLQEA